MLYEASLKAQIRFHRDNQFQEIDLVHLSGDMYDKRIITSDEPKPEFSSASRAMKVPSRAKLGHFNFRAETELRIF